MFYKLLRNLFFVSFCLLLSVIASAQVDLTNGLVAFYPFNGNANDASGNNRNGTTVNGTSFGSDRFGNANSAASFDGVDDYIRVTDNGAFSTPQMSMAIWMQTDAASLQVLVGKRDFTSGGGGGAQYQFFINWSSYPGFSSNLIGNNNPDCFNISNSSYVNTVDTVCTFKWYFFVATFDGTRHKLYVDGILKRDEPTGFTGMMGCNSDLRFGNWWQGDLRPFKGKLDEIRWYNRALNAEEVAALYVMPTPTLIPASCAVCSTLPQGTLTANNTCSGDSATITFNATAGQAPFTVILSDGTTSVAKTNLSANATFKVAPPTGTTTYTVMSIQDARACSRTNSFSTPSVTVNPNPKPTATVTPASATFCAGQSIPLSASGGTGYVWTPSSGLTNPNIANPIASPAGTTTYQVVVTNGSGCKDTANVTLTLSASATASASTSGPFCPGDSAQLTATGSGPFSWSPATGLSNPNIANPKAAPGATTTYTVTAGTGACTATATVTVTRLTKPTATTSVSAAVCPGDSAQLQAGGGTSYQWSPAVALSNPAIANPKAAPAATTAYDVYVTNAAGCKDTAAVTVSVLPKPTAVVAPALANFCAGASVPLTASGGSVYTWTPATGLSNPNIANPVATPPGSIIYKVVVANASGCRDSATITLNQNSLFIPGVTSSGAFCPGDSAQLTAAGGVSYAWSPATGLSNPNIPDPKAAPAATTTYTVTATNTAGCTGTKAITVTRLTKPTATATADAAICPGGSTLVRAGGGSSYQWFPATGLATPTQATSAAAPATTTLYRVSVTNTDGCKDTAAVTVTVNPKPTAAVSPTTATICAGDSVQLMASGGGSYAWSPAAGLSSTGIANPKAAPVATATYKVVVGNSFLCYDSTTVTVNVNPKPVINLAATGAFCAGDSLQLSASGGTIYSWSPATGLSNTFSPNPKAAPATNTSYQVVVTTAAGCKDSASSAVTANPKPVIGITPTTRLCRGDSLQLNATGGAAYQWTPATYLLNPNSSSPIAFPRDTTRYRVVVTTAAGCVDSAFTQIDVFRLPLVFQRRDTILCGGVTYMADASGLPGATSWLWSTGSTAPTYTITGPGDYWVQTQVTGCHNPIRDSIHVDTLGRPTVSLGPDQSICNYDVFFLGFTGTNIRSFVWSNGSTDSTIRVAVSDTFRILVSNPCGTAQDMVVIEVEACNDELYFPDGFTPNGDNKNDRYRAAHLPGVTVASYELHIYNRWGELVFSTNKLEEGWDGTFKGKQQDTGTFVWYAKYRKRAGEPERFKKGSFVLIR